MEEEPRQLTYKMIDSQLRAHDKRMRAGRREWALAKAFYQSEFWKYVRQRSGDDIHSLRTLENEIEVNRIRQIIASYKSALYPRPSTAVFTPDPTGAGDSDKSAFATNAWLQSKRIHLKTNVALDQALIYPGCGLKLGHVSGYGNPIDRVQMRVIPWWEMVLDQDVSDVEDMRFVGHIYFKPKHEVEKEYGLSKLTGTSRQDFLEDTLAGAHNTRSSQKRSDQKNAEADMDADNFVRVLEIINLVDMVEVDGVLLRGRYEVHLPDHSQPKRKDGTPLKIGEPIFVGPAPFAQPDGTPLAHIVPVIFDSEPEHPLRGIAPTKRMLSQCYEINIFRTFQAQAARKDSRQYLARKGKLNADDLMKITNGEDGYVAEVEVDDNVPLDDIIVPIRQQQLNTNIAEYLRQADNDLDRAVGASPNARGVITKATAFEIQAVQQFTESEYGRMATALAHAQSEVCRVFVRVLIGAMTDSGDSAGAYEEEDEALLGEVGAEPEDAEVDSVEDPSALDDDQAASFGEEPPDDEQEEDAMTLAERELADGATDSHTSPHLPSDEVPIAGMTESVPETHTLVLMKHGEPLEITVEDLDGSFGIDFKEVGGSPSQDVEMQQKLMGLMEPYSALLITAAKGGPEGVLALSYATAMFDKFRLPADLNPETLLLKMREAGQQQPAEDEAPAEGPSQEEVTQELLQMPPEEAIAVLREQFADDPEAIEVLDRAAAGSPEEQARIVQTLLGAGGEA